MNTKRSHRSHRSHRSKSNSSVWQRWLAKATEVARAHTDSRRLLCEQLERRYALHGLAWFDSFADRLDESESTVSNEICDKAGTRTHGLTAEGEGPGFNLDRGSMREQRNGPKFVIGNFVPNYVFNNVPNSLSDLEAPARPEPKIGDSIPAANDPAKVDLHSGLAPSTNDAVDQARPTSTIGLSPPSPSTTVSVALPRLSDFTATGRGLTDGGASGLPTNLSQSNSGNSTRSSLASTPSTATPTLAISKSEVSSLATQSTLTVRASLSSSNVTTARASDSDPSRSFESSWLRDAQRTSSELAASSEGDSAGLFQLRSLIETLANELTAGKSESAASGRTGQLNNHPSNDEFASLSHSQTMLNDGMLELAAASERLSPMDGTLAAADEVASKVQQRSQLIASLELNHEFELAGQSVKAIKNVVDSTASRRHGSAILAGVASEVGAEVGGDASDRRMSFDDSTTKPADIEPSIWQRSLLSLGFLAVGALLMRSRKKYRDLRVQSTSN